MEPSWTDTVGASWGALAAEEGPQVREIGTRLVEAWAEGGRERGGGGGKRVSRTNGANAGFVSSSGGKRGAGARRMEGRRIPRTKGRFACTPGGGGGGRVRRCVDEREQREDPPAAQLGVSIYNSAGMGGLAEPDQPTRTERLRGSCAPCPIQVLARHGTKLAEDLRNQEISTTKRAMERLGET